MEYERGYSKTQVHFVTQPPEWLSLLDCRKQFNSILDLGAGGGRNSIFLRKLYPDANIIALDLSLTRCIFCRRAVDTGVICGDSMALPFAENTFDMVVSTQVIEHVPDDHNFIKEINRVLKPCGITIVSSVAKLRFGFYFYRSRYGEWVLDPTHLREYDSVQELIDLFNGSFYVLKTNSDRFWFSPARFIYRLFLRIGLIQKPDPGIFAKTKLGKFLEKCVIPIPRYRHITVIAEKNHN